MTRTTGRRRLTCHHEAGHALVRWYFGHGTDRAVVLTVEEIRAGKLIEGWRGEPHAAEGSVVGYPIHEPPFGPTPQPFLNEALKRHRSGMTRLPLGITPRGHTREQAAEYCGCESLSTFDGWRRQGIVPGPRPGQP